MPAATASSSSSARLPSADDMLGHRIDHGRLELVAVLGVGAYGVVYRAVDTTPSPQTHALHHASSSRAPPPPPPARRREYAVKCLLKASLDTRQRQFQRREIALHQLASAHRNVVTMYKTIEEGEFIYVILDYCEDGDLFGMITDRQRYIGNDALIKRVFLQIVDAVEYCHSLGIYHRDLKPENILCANGGQDVYLADFGLATSEKRSSDFGCGSTFYMSPECQGGLAPNKVDAYSTPANDIWSLGIILVNLTCGRNPWRQACASDDTFRAFCQGDQFLRSILPISQDLNTILRHIFAPDPTQRVSLKQLRAMMHEIKSFNMSDAELRHAHAAAQAAHAAVVKPSRQQQQQSAAAVVPKPQQHATQHRRHVSGAAAVVAPIIAQHARFDLPPESHTPLLAINRTRSSSGDGSSSLPPTPEASAQDPPPSEVDTPSCFFLDHQQHQQHQAHQQAAHHGPPPVHHHRQQRRHQHAQAVAAAAPSFSHLHHVQHPHVVQAPSTTAHATAAAQAQAAQAQAHYKHLAAAQAQQHHHHHHHAALRDLRIHMPPSPDFSRGSSIVSAYQG